MTRSGELLDMTYIKEKGQEIDRLLDRFLPPTDKYPGRLHEAMRYSVLAGGKRIRPILALTAYDACGGKNPAVINPAACALEIVHTYSLIHDDLPCMDDDDLRRGRPTLHKKYDDATAVLAGDALHVLAFQLAAQSGSIDVVRELADAIGTDGMLGGQMADVEAEGKEIDLAMLSYIHSHKTGALIRGSVRIGAILADADTDRLGLITHYGEKIGLAFQIIDDILDIIGEQEKLGKQIGSDSKNSKATYPALVGLDLARSEARRLIDESIELSRQISADGEYFAMIARFIGQRDR